MKNNKAVMFMHVATPVIGNNHAYNTTYERIIKDIVEKGNKSGLFDYIDYVHFNVVGDLPFPEHLLNFDNYKITRVGNLLDYELPTLRLLRDFVDNNKDYKVLYTQTLSVSTWNWNDPKMMDRRNMHFYFSIENFLKCIEKLETHDSCGANWNKDMRDGYEDYVPHYSGNIWWANAEYLSKLPTIDWIINPENFILDYRHQAEFWIGMDEKHKHFNFFSWADIEKENALPLERYKDCINK